MTTYRTPNAQPSSNNHISISSHERKACDTLVPCYVLQILSLRKYRNSVRSTSFLVLLLLFYQVQSENIQNGFVLRLFVIAIVVIKSYVSVSCRPSEAPRVFFLSNTAHAQAEICMIDSSLHNSASSATVSPLMLAPASRRSRTRPRDPTLRRSTQSKATARVTSNIGPRSRLY